MDKYLKAIKFKEFSIFDETISFNEIKALEDSDLDEIVSSTKTNLIKRGNDLYIYEWKKYTIITDNEKILNKIYFHDGYINKSNQEGYLIIKNYIGLIKVLNYNFYVISKKATYEEVEKLSKYINEKITSLSLEYHSQGITRGSFNKKNNINKDYQFIQVYNYIKSNELEKNIKIIMNKPHTTMNRIKVKKDINNIDEFEEENLIEVYSGSTTFFKSDRKIIKGLNYFYPAYIMNHKNFHSYDNSENQFILFFLKKILSIINSQLRDNEKNSKFEKSFINDLVLMRNSITRMINLRFFNNVASINNINRSSTVLTKLNGYKDIYRFYCNLNNGIDDIMSFSDMIQLFMNKSIDKLYEYYALFTFIDILKEYFNSSSIESDLLTKYEKFTIKIDESNKQKEFVFKNIDLEVHLSFQKIYNIKNQGTYSINMIPDFTIKVIRYDKDYLFHFDTKFRINNSGYDINAKESDLSIMHSYKDGILNTCASIALYPGNIYSKSNLYQQPNSKNNIFEGVGAIPLSLNHDNNELKIFIFELLNKLKEVE